MLFGKALTRPFVFFSKELIIQVAGLYMMFVYGLLYIFLTTLPTIFRVVYQERPGIAGLNYIALGIGITGASQTSAAVMDKVYAKLKQKHGTGKPEFRLRELPLRLPFYAEYQCPTDVLHSICKPLSILRAS